MTAAQLHRPLPPTGISSQRIEEKRFEEKKVYVCNIDDGLAGSVNIFCNINNSSKRLTCCMWVYWEQTVGTTEPTGTLTLQHIIKPPDSSISDQVMSANILSVTTPTYQEQTSGSKRFRATIGTGTLAAGNSGHWVLFVRWEPNVEINDKDLKELLSRCDASLHGAMRKL